MKINASKAAVLALTVAAGLAACSHDKTRDETAMRDPVTAADTPTAVNSSDDATYIHTAKTAEQSPSVDVAQMESTPAATTNNTLASPETASDDSAMEQNKSFETASRK